MTGVGKQQSQLWQWELPLYCEMPRNCWLSYTVSAVWLMKAIYNLLFTSAFCKAKKRRNSA